MKILVVEDEMIISEDIAMMLSDQGYEVTDQAVDYEEAISSLTSKSPDLALLDINLIGRKDGIDIANKINEIGRIPFIFTSSLRDTATIDRAKQTNPAAYLIKPFQEAQLMAAIEIAMTNFSKVNDASQREEKITIFNNAIFVKAGHRYTKVKIEDIQYIQKSDNYIDLFTSTKKFVIRASIGGFLEQLAIDKIIRIHRSYAVNTDHITDMAPTYVIIGDKEIPLAKSYTNDLMARLKIF